MNEVVAAVIGAALGSVGTGLFLTARFAERLARVEEKLAALSRLVENGFGN